MEAERLDFWGLGIQIGRPYRPLQQPQMGSFDQIFDIGKEEVILLPVPETLV